MALLHLSNNQAAVRSDRRSGLGGERSNAPHQMTLLSGQPKDPAGPTSKAREPGGRAIAGAAGRAARPGPALPSRGEAPQAAHSGTRRQDRKRHQGLRSATLPGEIDEKGPKPGRASQVDVVLVYMQQGIKEVVVMKLMTVETNLCLSSRLSLADACDWRQI
ncbi:hypothetical protein NDU88_001184 [Pleurodeles waltl]|uniref:Uncharacterized protein n=1 Tax=Pleurodeles waltl TaxID=8319 RepID=A0AAV7VZQ2_PLEWA|nr:hypothetical protein NDU88_001184 [Pleurodeles waltl]